MASVVRSGQCPLIYTTTALPVGAYRQLPVVPATGLVAPVGQVRQTIGSFDALLHKMGEQLVRIDAAGSAVRGQQARLDLMPSMGAMRDCMSNMLKNPDPGRSALQHMFGGDCVRIARCRSLIDAAVALEIQDQRLASCRSACDSVEAVLRDLGLGVSLRRAQEAETEALRVTRANSQHVQPPRSLQVIETGSPQPALVRNLSRISQTQQSWSTPTLRRGASAPLYAFQMTPSSSPKGFQSSQGPNMMDLITDIEDRGLGGEQYELKIEVLSACNLQDAEYRFLDWTRSTLEGDSDSRLRAVYVSLMLGERSVRTSSVPGNADRTVVFQGEQFVFSYVGERQMSVQVLDHRPWGKLIRGDPLIGECQLVLGPGIMDGRWKHIPELKIFRDGQDAGAVAVRYQLRKVGVEDQA